MPLAPLNMPPGVVKPASPLQAAGRYWDANLVRWRAGKLLPVGGWQRITSSPLTSAARLIFPWVTDIGSSLAAIGCSDKLLLLDGATYQDITPSGFVGAEAGAVGGYGAADYGELLYGDDTDPTYPRPPSLAYLPVFSWSIDTWGQSILAVASSDGRLLSYSAGDTQAQAVTGPDTANRWVIVTPERHAVLLGYGGNPRRVAWSNREDYTDWDFTSTTNTAGYLDLDTQNKIVAAAPVREGTLIWTENEAFLMRFIGLPYVYSIEQIGHGCGLMAPRSFATAAGRCFWMGREGFWLYDGGVVRPLGCDVGSFVFDDVDPTTGGLYAHGSDNNIFPEIWWWYPSAGSDHPDRYVVFNFAENWWTVGGMTRTAACGAGVFPYPIAGDEAGELYFQESGWTAAGAPITTARYAETGALNLQAGGVISHLRQAMTDSGYGYNSTAITVYSSYTPEGTESTFGPYSPRSDGYTDMRASGRDFRLRIASTQDAEWSIGQMRIEFTGGGGR